MNSLPNAIPAGGLAQGGARDISPPEAWPAVPQCAIPSLALRLLAIFYVPVLALGAFDSFLVVLFDLDTGGRQLWWFKAYVEPAILFAGTVLGIRMLLSRPPRAPLLPDSATGRPLLLVGLFWLPFSLCLKWLWSMEPSVFTFLASQLRTALPAAAELPSILLFVLQSTALIYTAFYRGLRSRLSCPWALVLVLIVNLWPSGVLQYERYGPSGALYSVLSSSVEITLGSWLYERTRRIGAVALFLLLTSLI